MVDTVEYPFGKPAGPRSASHWAEDTIARVFSNLFSFLFQRSTKEERVAQYVVREHGRGRALREILEDHYVVNRLDSPAQRARLLDRPEIVRVFVEADIAAEKETLATGSTS